MSFLTNALSRFNDKSTTTVNCPQCGKRSKQTTVKIQREQAMLCPHCKALFVIPR